MVPTKAPVAKKRSPQDEAARAAGLLRTAAREIAEAPTGLTLRYRKRIRLMAILADRLSKQIYEEYDEYERSHQRKGQSGGAGRLPSRASAG
jgi:hypothetical protein